MHAVPCCAVHDVPGMCCGVHAVLYHCGLEHWLRTQACWACWARRALPKCPSRRLPLSSPAWLPACLRTCPLLPCLPAVRGKLKKAGAISNMLFNAAYAYKLFLLKRGVPYG